MADKSSNLLGLAPSTWITLAVAAMGIFALNQYPFRDTRPPDRWVPTYSHTASEDQDVEARLWQDPLSAVETARRVDDAKDKATAVPIVTGSTKNAQPEGAAPEMFKCSKALSEKTSAKAPASDGFHSASHLCQSIATVVHDGYSVLVVAAIVSGAPYTADVENRRRTRYAVLAGLYRSGYMPLNNQHVGYVRLAEFYGDPTRANDLAAFEWFDSNVDTDASAPLRPSRVLLLWLDQDGFRKDPISQFSKIADGILPNGVQSLILGPADSDGLRAMVKEFNATGAPHDANARQIDIYSERASAAGDAIMRGILPNAALPTRLEFPGVNVHLYRTIASDDDLAKVVLGELADRRIKLDEIALIAERDTLYGRAMGEYFGGCANPPRTDPSSPSRDGRSRPLCLTYLKGLDGIGPPPPKQAAAPNGASASDGKASEEPSRDMAPDVSTGPRQLDYLRRMGVALAALQGAPPPGCKPSDPPEHSCRPRYIKAIGVLGTDIYDKLLVLQELRPMFPDVVFFSFGLDARFTDDENLAWTRQLLVGSSLGLSLRSDLQGDIPVFRDSYQSATFYATLLALHRASVKQPDKSLPEDAGLQWTRRAMVFEIGRKQPLDLNMDTLAGPSCQFDADCPSISSTRTNAFLSAVTPGTASWLIVLAPGMLWILLRAALGGPPMHRRLGVLPLTATGLIVILAVAGAVALHFSPPWSAVLSHLTRNGHHMPVPIADGASHWGKELLELFLIPLVIILLIRGQRKLNANADKIQNQFRFEKDYHALIHCYGMTMRAASWRCKLKEWTYFPIGYLSNDRDKLPQLPGISPLESLIARYLYRGVWQKRWVRVIAMTLAFILVLKGLEWLGFSQFAGVPWILTQMRKHGVEGWITFLGLTFMQVLIFWVIDAILLTRAFLLDLERDEPQWPKNSLKSLHAELGLPDELAAIWLNLRLVAQRTSWVGTFIWYPSLVIAGIFAATFTFEYGRYRFETNPVTLIAGVALIVASVVVLREAAESWRADVLRKLDNRRLSLLAVKPSNPDAIAQTQVLIDLVSHLRDGSFAPYSEQPLVRAVLLPTVTFAATAGFPYLHVTG
jgi:hypothetical protein